MARFNVASEREKKFDTKIIKIVKKLFSEENEEKNSFGLCCSSR